MANRQFHVDYRFYVFTPPSTSYSPASSPIAAAGTTPGWAPNSRSGGAFSLRNMVQCEASLFTTDSIGQLQATFADNNGTIDQVVSPHAMCVVQLLLKNAFGAWGTAWTGFIDTIHRVTDPNAGQYITFNCSSPYKLWEVQNLSPQDIQTIVVAMGNQMLPSNFMAFAADRVGYGASNVVLDSLNIDPPQGIFAFPSSAQWYDPDQQSWDAVTQGIVGQIGAEFFFNEDGFAFFRRNGFLQDVQMNTYGTGGAVLTPVGISATQSTSKLQYGVPAGIYRSPRVIEPQDVIHADMTEGDAGIVTQILVRYSPAGPTQFLQATYQAPTPMVHQLKQRILVVYANWLLTYSAAQFLASSLGEMYSSNTLGGTVTIPADPMFRIGSLCQVLSLQGARDIVDSPLPATTGLPGPTEYYIQGITYNLQWGGPWVMTMGLSYGRALSQSFPYVGNLNFPVLQNSTLNSTPGAVQPGVVFALGLNTDTSDPLPSLNAIYADPQYILPNSLVMITDVTGLPIGPSPNGNYIVFPRAVGTTILFQQLTKSMPKIGMFQYIRAGSNPPPTSIGIPYVQNYAPGNQGGSGATGTGAGQISMYGGQSYTASTPPNQSTTDPGLNNGSPPTGPLTTQYTSAIPNTPTTWTPTAAPLDAFTVAQGAQITQIYNNPETFDGGVIGHDGIDFTTVNMRPGSPAPVYAVSAGQVLSAWDWNDGFGFCVRIISNNIVHFYGHLLYPALWISENNPEISYGDPWYEIVSNGPIPQSGDLVNVGQLIGYANNTGSSYGTHLHFGIHQIVNPAANGGGPSSILATEGQRYDWFYQQQSVNPGPLVPAIAALFGNGGWWSGDINGY